MIRFEMIVVRGGGLIVLLFKIRAVSSACSRIRDGNIQLNSAALEFTTRQIHM